MKLPASAGSRSLERGINAGNAVLLAGVAAGDFSTMTFDERAAVAKAITEEAAGQVPVAMGGKQPAPWSCAG